MNDLKVITVVGARPQFIKAGVLSRAMRPHVQELLVHTGQHYDVNMSDVFFAELQLPKPDYHLQVGSGTHGFQTGRMLPMLEEIMIRERPDAVLVYGDTNSTLAGSLAAAKLRIPIAHVEAGLRSYNRRMPEELNRVLTDHCSALLFCPTATAVRNLRQEGISDNVHLVGDIMYDSVLFYREQARKRSGLLRLLGLKAKRYNLATIHRAENTDDSARLRAILEALRQLDPPVVLPLHPRTNKQIESAGLRPLLAGPSIVAIEPLSYLDMLCLSANARTILTDSGGLQKEAYMLKVPCVTLRDETEWVETVEAGWNRVAGADPEAILQAARQPRPPSDHPPLYGDGRAADRIAELMTTLGG